MAGVQAGHMPGRVAAFHDVVARTTMHMQVDEARKNQRCRAVAHRSGGYGRAGDGVDAALRVQREATVHKAGGGEDIAA